MHKMIVVKKNQKYQALVPLSHKLSAEHQDRSNSRIISTEHMTNPSQKSLN